MKKLIFSFTKIILLLLILLLFQTCEYNNEEDLYLPPVTTYGAEYANFPLNGIPLDVSGHDIILGVNGNPKYTLGITGEIGDSAIELNGKDQFLTIFAGYLDTIAVSLWFKGNIDYAKDLRDNKPTLIDYGQRKLYSHIDAYTFATVVYTDVDSQVVKNDESTLTSNGNWTHLYVAAGGEDTTKVKVYMFGSLMAETKFPGKLNPLNDLLYIGRASKADDLSITFYQGSFDEIRIYNHFLTDDEIKLLSQKNTYLTTSSK